MIFATLVCAALASEHAEFDSGLSLLQLRAQKIDQEPKYYAGEMGTVCNDGEDLTLAQCLEILYNKTDVPNNGIASWSIMGNDRSGPNWKVPKGCRMDGAQRLTWNDQPAGTAHRSFRPLCSKQGGRAAEIASQGASCKEPTCVEPVDGVDLLHWEGDGVVLPELQVLAPGSLCEPCGLLTYAQCAKATDMGLIKNLQGGKILQRPLFQVSGSGHSRPAVPSGCAVEKHASEFSPYDTPDGALAGLVSSSGVGVPYGRYSPVCGVCTTTTTTPATTTTTPSPEEEEDDDSASAVGDPHLTTNTGKHYTLEH